MPMKFCRNWGRDLSGSNWQKTEPLDAGFRAREDRIKWAPQKLVVILGMALNTQIGCLGRSYLDYKGRGALVDICHKDKKTWSKCKCFTFRRSLNIWIFFKFPFVLTILIPIHWLKQNEWIVAKPLPRQNPVEVMLRYTVDNGWGGMQRNR